MTRRTKTSFHPGRGDSSPCACGRLLAAALLAAALCGLPAGCGAPEQRTGPDDGAGAPAAAPPWSPARAPENPLEIPSLLTHDAAVRIALERSPNLHAASARIGAARARITQARAGYFPSFDLSAAASRTKQNFETIQVPDVDLSARYWSYSATLSGSWVLFDGLAREARVLGTKASWLESVSAYEDARRLLIQAVDLAYNTALLARENIRIAEADAGFNKELLEETRLKVEAGSASLSERHNFEIRLNAASSQLISAQNELSIAMAVLAELMGLPGTTEPTSIALAPLGEESEDDLAPPHELEELAFALRSRPDLDALRHAIKTSEAQVDENRAANLPTVFLQGEYGYRRLDNPHFDQDDLTGTGSLNLAWNLFNGFSDRAGIQAARFATEQKRKELAAQWLAVISEVRQAVAQVAASQAQLILQRENHRLTLDTRDLVLKEYQAGQASLVRLNEAQRDLIEAEGNLSLARIAVRQVWNNLHAATARNLYVKGEIRPK
jgi:outer membrane protein TolC